MAGPGLVDMAGPGLVDMAGPGLARRLLGLDRAEGRGQRLVPRAVAGDALRTGLVAPLPAGQGFGSVGAPGEPAQPPQPESGEGEADGYRVGGGPLRAAITEVGGDAGQEEHGGRGADQAQ